MAKSAKKAKGTQENLPELVTVMTKLVERLESLEKKTDLVITRLAALPSEIRQISSSATPVSHTAPQTSGPRERVLYEAVCADCRKGCKVPFRPNENRPVYCPECWAIRKVGHVPQNPDQGSLIPKEKRVMPVSAPMDIVVSTPKTKKQKAVSKSSSKASKKKKK